MFEIISKAIRLNSTLQKFYFTMFRVFGTISSDRWEGKEDVEYIFTGLNCGKYNMALRWYNKWQQATVTKLLYEGT